LRCWDGRRCRGDGLGLPPFFGGNPKFWLVPVALKFGGGPDGKLENWFADPGDLTNGLSDRTKFSKSSGGSSSCWAEPGRMFVGSMFMFVFSGGGRGGWFALALAAACPEGVLLLKVVGGIPPSPTS